MTETDKIDLMSLCVVHGHFLKKQNWSSVAAMMAAQSHLARCMAIIKAIQPTPDSATL